MPFDRSLLTPVAGGFDRSKLVPIQEPSPTNPQLDVSLAQVPATPEEREFQNIEGVKRIRELAPGYNPGAVEQQKGLWEMATSPLAHLVTPKELADAVDTIKATFGYDPESVESAELVQEELAQPSRPPSTPEQIIAGVQNVAAETTTSPLALALPAAGALPSGAQKALMYGFTAQQLAHLPQAIKQAKEAKTPYERTKAYLGLAADIVLPAAVAGHEGMRGYRAIQNRGAQIRQAEPIVEAPIVPEAAPLEVAAKPVEQVTPPEAVAAKEPWQMTKDEGDLWVDKNMINAVQTDKGRIIAKNVEHGDLMPALEETGSTFNNPNSRGWALIGKKPSQSYIGVDDVQKANGDFHKAYVMKALREGKPVPPEVLADYPDLKPAERAPETPQSEEIGPLYHGSPDFIGEVFDPVHRGRGTGLSRGGFNFTKDIETARTYAKESVDAEQASVDLANSAMRDAAQLIEAGTKIPNYKEVSDLPEFNTRHIDDFSDFKNSLLELADKMPAEVAQKLKAAAQINQYTPTPAIVTAYIRNPKRVEVRGKTTWVAERPEDIRIEKIDRPAKTSVESPGPGAASPQEFAELKTLDFSENRFLPDFLERTKERAIFSEPFAIGRILQRVPVLGRLIDPNVKSNTYEQQGLAAYFAARHGVGPANAAFIGNRYGKEIRDAFKADESGNLNVTPTGADQSLKISDVFEGLERSDRAYNLNPEQRRVWNDVLKPILAEKRDLVRKYDIAETEDANGDVIGHFHRIVTKFPEGKEPLVRMTGQSVGARIPSQRGRVFRRSEQEGWEKGYEYERDPVKRLVSDIERTYKAIADKRLIADPVFAGRTKAEMESQLRDFYNEELASGEISEKSFQNILENRMAQGRVYQPGYSGQFFEPKTAKLINDALQGGDFRLRRVIEEANDMAKAVVLGFDVGVGQIQLLNTLVTNPSKWAKANWLSLKAMLNPDVFPEYIRHHEQAVRELAQAGSSVGRFQDFLTGLKPGQAITKIPVIGKAAEAFGRQFQTALDVAKIELWEAVRDTTPPDQRLQVIRTIESQLNMGRMESIGVGGRQALLERVTLLASSYYRGAINNIAGIAEPGVSGQMARRNMTKLLGGGLALYYGIGKMLGMADEELERRLNPARPDFLQWTFEGEKGRKINMGIGGIHRSLLRLAGNMVKTSVEHPGNWLSLSTEKNPITRWLRGHAAIVTEGAFSALSGRDFMGQETDMGTILGNLAPLTVQQLFRREGEPPVTVKELAASFLGLNAYPESTRNQYIREREDNSAKQFGKAFEDLKLKDQLKITRELSKKEPFNTKEPATQRQIDQALKADVERLKRITTSLPEPLQKNLHDAGLHVTGYKPSLTIGPDKLLLTENQQKRFEQLLVEEYGKRLAQIKFPSLMKLDIEARQKRFNAMMEPAKTKAHSRLLQEMQRNNAKRS